MLIWPANVNNGYAQIFRGVLTQMNRLRKMVRMNRSKELKQDWLPKLPMRYAGQNCERKSRMRAEFGASYEPERKDAIKQLCGGLPPPGGRGPQQPCRLIEPVGQQN